MIYVIVLIKPGNVNSEPATTESFDLAHPRETPGKGGPLRGGKNRGENNRMKGRQKWETKEKGKTG
jgi:hypothetical protein